MKSSTEEPERPPTGRWYVLGGVAGIGISLVLPGVGTFLLPISLLVLPLGLLKWTYEASTLRARKTGVGEVRKPSQVASVVYFTEVALLGLFALGFFVFNLIAVGLGSPIDADAEDAQNQALLVVLAFLILAFGVLAWGVNRWVFRRRTTYVIPLMIPVAAVLTDIAVDAVLGG